MFSCKGCKYKEAQTPMKDREVTLPTPPLEERIVACQDCKHLLYKKDAQKVRVVTLPQFFTGVNGTRWLDGRESAVYYCPSCRKPYDYMEKNRQEGTIGYFRTVPAVPERHEEVTFPPKKKSGHRPIPLAEV